MQMGKLKPSGKANLSSSHKSEAKPGWETLTLTLSRWLLVPAMKAEDVAT